MNKLEIFDWVAIGLTIVGGLNWGFVGLFQFDLVAMLFGEMSMLSKIVYSLVGISSAYLAFLSLKLAKK